MKSRRQLFSALWAAATVPAFLAMHGAVAETRSPEELERLVSPYAGVPPQVLLVMFDAARYPGNVMESAQWLGKPDPDRGPPPKAQASVRRLTDEAPQVVAYLSGNIAATTQLGDAYREQPNDLWMAYGEVTTRLPAQAPSPPLPDKAATPSTPPIPANSEAPAATQQAVVTPPPSPAPVVVTPPPSPPPPPVVVSEPSPTVIVQQAPAPVVAAPAPVVAAPTVVSGGDTTTAALTGGAIGLIGGMALGALINDNNDESWSGYPVPAPYPAAYPRPYSGGYPAARGAYAGAYSGAYAGQSAANQAQRQSSATQMQQSSQAAQTQRQQTSQTNQTQRQQSRQAAQHPC
jgi:hypothetical protein